MTAETTAQIKQQQAYAVMAAVNARDFEQLATAELDPALEFHSLFGTMEGDGVYVGRDGLRDWWQSTDAVLDNFLTEPYEYHDMSEDRAVILFHVTGVGKASGLPIDLRMAQVWSWRDGVPWRAAAYLDQQAAFDAAQAD